MHDKKKLGDGVKKAIARTAHKNEVVKGVNEYGKTAWNSWMKTEYPLEKPIVKPAHTAKLKSGAKLGQGVKDAIAKQKEKNRLAQGRNDHKKVTGGKPDEDVNVPTFGKQDKSQKKRFGAGEGGGSIPSGTNTNVPKYKTQAGCDPMVGRRIKPDGSFGY